MAGECKSGVNREHEHGAALDVDKLMTSMIKTHGPYLGEVFARLAVSRHINGGGSIRYWFGCLESPRRVGGD